MKLTFRTTGIPAHIKHRAALLLGLFVVCLVVFEILANLREEEEISVIAAPTLPTVSFEALDTHIGELHGYVDEMDAGYMRDSVIPLDSTRRLPIEINTYGTEVTGIRYEIRSMDTSRKIAETTIEDYTAEGEYIYAEPVIETLVEEGSEYLWMLTLTLGDRDVHYYARLLLPSEAHERECLAFVRRFHEAALSGNETEIVPYLETSGDEDADTLGHVTIESTLQQVCWGGFDGFESVEPVIEFKDISANYNVIELYFRMQRNTDGYTQYYNVTEYFKVRYTEDVMYLLDYEREMEEILQPRHVSVTDSRLTIGVVTGNDAYISNETGSVVAFVQAGALYEYNRSRDELIRIFDFRGNNPVDSRANYNEHGIRLLNIDETGAVDFVIYGYMNAGGHEGECGIDLYHYDSTTNLAKEQAFLASTKSYQILGAGFSELLYRSEAGDFYIMVDGTLIHVDLTTMRQEEMLSDMSEDRYAVAGSSRYLAWIDDEIVSDAIHIMDLETGRERLIEADDDEQLRVIAFMDDDLVYGQVRRSDVTVGLSGREIYPMYRIQIGTVTEDDVRLQKTYEKSGYYVIDVTKASYTLYLERISVIADDTGAVTYVDASDDTIMNSSGERHSAVELRSDRDEILGRVYAFAIGGEADAEEDSSHQVRLVYSGLVVMPELVSITADTSGAATKYYVYVGSRVVLSGNDVVKAIIKADEEMGTVVDNKQQYIWKRGRALYRSAFSGIYVGSEDAEAPTGAQALSAILTRNGKNIEVNTLLERGESPCDVLRSAMREVTILDLAGCTVQETLYYVYLGAPVYARTGADEAVLIVGYDTSGILVYEPAIDDITRMSLDEAGDYFAERGNIFLSYIPGE